jgi:hypothetical protein
MIDKKHVLGRLKFLWSRLPYTAVYFIASLVILKGLHYVAFKYVLPTNYFIRSFSMTVTGTVENTDVPIRVCRDRRGNYRGDVFRTIRVIPDGKSAEDAVFAGKYNIKQINIDGDRCENLQITTDQFSHSPGRYVVGTNFCFKSQYNREHCIEYKSNVYEIRPATVSDFDAKIRDLERQIEALKKTSDSITSEGITQAQPRSSTDPSSNANSTRSTGGTTNNSTTTNNTTNNNTTTPPPPPPSYTECISDRSGLFGTVTGVIGCL